MFCERYLAQLAVEHGRRADFPPRFLAVNATGTVAILHADDLLGSPAAKLVAGEQLFPELVRMVDATRFCWASSAFVVNSANEPRFAAWREAHPDVSWEGAPGVFEAVQVMFGEWTGEQTMRVAPIVRLVGGRRRWSLGPWENPLRAVGVETVNYTNPDMRMGGVLVEDAQRAVMGSATGPEFKAATQAVATHAGTAEAIDKAFLEIATSEGLSVAQIEEIVGRDDLDDPEYRRLLDLAADKLIAAGENEKITRLMREQLGRRSPLR